VLHALRHTPEKGGYIFDTYNPSYLHEWRIDLQRDSVREKRIGNIGVELPCINPGYVGRKAQFAYMLVDGYIAPLDNWAYPPQGMLYTALVKYELGTGKVADRLDAPFGTYLSEPCFVPRENSSEEKSLSSPSNVRSNEDDGFIVLFATNAVENKCFLMIADARCLKDGPISMLELPHKVAVGLHGCFMPYDA